VYYNCVEFHKNSISSLVGVALTRYMPPPFRESISWINSPFKFWTATIFLHAHLHVVYYKCVKFHKNPISRLWGVALTRYMDGRTDREIPIYPPNFVCGGYSKHWFIWERLSVDKILSEMTFKDVYSRSMSNMCGLCLPFRDSSAEEGVFVGVIFCRICDGIYEVEIFLFLCWYNIESLNMELQLCCLLPVFCKMC
jgi:hypothetical protein